MALCRGRFRLIWASLRIVDILAVHVQDNLNITGGEPTRQPGLSEMVGRARNKTMCVMTLGQFLMPRDADWDNLLPALVVTRTTTTYCVPTRLARRVRKLWEQQEQGLCCVAQARVLTPPYPCSFRREAPCCTGCQFRRIRWSAVVRTAWLASGG